MNLKEMIRLCCSLIGAKDDIAEESNIKTEDDKSLYSRLVHGINSAYRLIARDVYRPVWEERVRIDKNSRVNINSLSRGFSQLRAVRGKGGESLAAKETKDYIYVAAAPGTLVEISYYYVPDALTQPEDEPVLPQGRVDPRAYVYYALSLYYTSEGRYADARAWELRYRSVVDNISENRQSRFLPMRRWR